MKDIPPLDDGALERLRSKVEWLGKHIIYTAGNGGDFHLLGEDYAAQRVVWRHVNGPIPDGHYVYRICGQGGCLHPDHLECGTDFRSTKRKLTSAQVREMRKRFAENPDLTYGDLADEYDAGYHYVGKIIRYDVRQNDGPPEGSDVRARIEINRGNFTPGEYRSKGRNNKRREDGRIEIPELSDRDLNWRIMDRTETTPSGCQLFTGNTTHKGGYGILQINGDTMRVHRVVFRNKCGEIPDGAHIHHTCGKKLCVNPNHLEALVPKDHANRHYGKDNPKLTDSEIAGIRETYEQADVSYADLSKEYGISRGYVGRIIREEVRT